MLRASAKGKNGPVIIAGLSECNVERLKANKPIRAELRSFGVDADGVLLMFYGKTEADMELEFRKAGLITDETTGMTDPKVDQEAAARAGHEHILIMTVGLPRSGKTTWSRTQAYPIVNPDSIRLALHGQRFYGPAEPMVWATAKLMVDSLFRAGHKHVILDATAVQRKRRDEWQSKGWGTFFKHIDTPKEVCLARAAAEDDQEIIPVIERMDGQFEPLGPDEMRW
jgi:predicted kinase